MPFQRGNKLGSRKRIFEHEIRKAIEQGDPNLLRRIAEKLLAKAEEGDLNAIREIADRLDGKAHQTFSGEVEHKVNTGEPADLLERLRTRVAERAPVDPVPDPTVQ